MASLFQKTILDLCHKSYDRVRIGSITDIGCLKTRSNDDIMNDHNFLTNIQWYFAGGVFGGDRDSLLKFADLMRANTEFIVFTRHTITWEVNIWVFIYLVHPELFIPYSCNHDARITAHY